MYLYLLVYLSYLLITIQTTSSLPSNTSSTHNVLTLPPTNTTSPSSLQDIAVHWPLSDTLTLYANIGRWKLPVPRMLTLLELAANAIGKKPANQYLTEKWTQNEGPWINRMLFEIEPAFEGQVLTWADVGAVLGEEKGMLAFYEHFGVWTAAEFDVVHAERGVLAVGSLRKWWQGFGVGGNGTVGGDMGVGVV